MNGTLCAGKIVLVNPGIRPVACTQNRSGVSPRPASTRERTHGRWTDQDACNDLGDDLGLSEVAEEEVEEAREGDDDESLDDEEDERAAQATERGSISYSVS